MTSALNSQPKARAAAHATAVAYEEELAAATRWCAESAGRTSSQAIATGRWPLITSVDALDHARMRRMADGSRVHRDDQQILTPTEFIELKRRYRSAGWTGECGMAQQHLLQEEMLKILKSRGADGPAFTTAEHISLTRNPSRKLGAKSLQTL